MGYSGRYHAASLLAVFIALAVGILIGIGLADDVVSSASQSLEDSLRSDLDDANGRADDLDAELQRERQFSRLAFPALVANRLNGSRVAIVSFGGLADDVRTDVEAAVEPAGASVAAIAVIDQPPDLQALRDLAPARLGETGRSQAAAALRQIGQLAGSQLSGDGALLQRLRATLFSRISGDLSRVNRVVFVQSDGEPPADQADAFDALRSGLLEGAASTAAAVSAVERSSTDPSTLGLFQSAEIPTVDDIDLVAGRLALVSTLLGAEGSYGVKDSADSYLPELLDPSSSRSTQGGAGEGSTAP